MTVRNDHNNQLLHTGKKLGVLLVVAIVCGLIGALFSGCISWVTTLRQSNGWLILLLPAAGVLSVVIDRLLRTQGIGTDHVLRAARGEETLSPRLTPSIFLCSACSHLVGASVGREGAALQLGGGIASFFGGRFRLSTTEQALLVRCGMAGVFSAVFGTPLAAAVFAMEVVMVGNYSWELIPLLATSLVSYGTSMLVGGHAERFPLTEIPSFNLSVLLTVGVIALASTVVSSLFCYALRGTKKTLRSCIPNAFLRIVAGGAVLVALTIVVGAQRYNGAGTDVIEAVFSHGEVNWWDFLLKLLFTVIAVSSGYKGGEIIPSLFIGAMFGGFMACLLGLPCGFGAAIGMTVLFCGATNCPLASLLLAAELFSWQGVPYMILAVVIAFLLSGRISLYTSQTVTGFKNRF